MYSSISTFLTVYCHFPFFFCAVSVHFTGMEAINWGPPWWLSGNPPASAGDVGLIPALGRSPGGGNGNPLQHSCLENPMDRGAWRAVVHGAARSQA